MRRPARTFVWIACAIAVPAIFLVTLGLHAAYAVTGPVTPPQYAAVRPGQTKHHVQQSFGTRGERVTLWAGPHGWVHLWKNYPTTDKQWVQITYSHGPHATVWRVAQHHGKAICPDFHTRCEGAST